jgi:putative transcriptional regulator
MKTSSRKTRSRPKTVDQEILEGLRTFRDALRSGDAIERRFTVRKVRINPEPLRPTQYDAAGVRAVRERLQASQAVFAQLLGVSLKLIQAWEQGTRIPDALACHVLDDITRDHQFWMSKLKRALAVA